MVGKLEIHGSIWYYLSFLTGMKQLYLAQFRLIPRNLNFIAQQTWLFDTDECYFLHEDVFMSSKRTEIAAYLFLFFSGIYQ